MDALALLHQDHVKLASLFDRYVLTKDVDERMDIVEQIRQDFLVHSSIEETLVYPKLRELAPNKDAVALAFEEHHLLEILVCEIDRLEVGTEEFSVKLALMKKLITEHVKQEETVLFDLATQVLGTDGLRDLGARIEAAKAEKKPMKPRMTVTMLPEAEAAKPQKKG